jgi:hypothetical protein
VDHSLSHGDALNPPAAVMNYRTQEYLEPFLYSCLYSCHYTLCVHSCHYTLCVYSCHYILYESVTGGGGVGKSIYNGRIQNMIDVKNGIIPL